MQRTTNNGDQWFPTWILLVIGAPVYAVKWVWSKLAGRHQ